MKELGSEVAWQAEDNQPTQPNSNPIHRTGRPVETEQTSRSSAQEIYTRFLLCCESTNLSVERSDKDMQQNNAYNPFSDESKKMIRDIGNVELFELCETIPKVQCSECLLYWNQGIVYCTCGHLLRENTSSRHIHRLQLDILYPDLCNQEWSDLMAIVMVKPKHKRSTSSPIIEERDVSKKGFEGIYDGLQIFSWLATQNWSDWSKMHPDGRGWRRKISPIAYRPKSVGDIRRPGLSLSTHLDVMHQWNSDQTSETH